MVEMRGNVSRAYTYNLYVRAFTAQDSTTWSAQWGESASYGVEADGRTIRFPLDLNALGHPTWLAVAAETRRDITIDHSGVITLLVICLPTFWRLGVGAALLGGYQVVLDSL